MLGQFESRGDWKRMDRYLSELRKVSGEDVKRVAARYLRLENCSLVEYLPGSMDVKNRTIESVRNTLEALLAPSTDGEQGLRDKETALSIDLPENRNDFRYSPVEYPFQTASVLRGPEIYIREDHTAPLIHMGLFYPGGRLSETETNSGITHLMVRMMLQGTAKNSAYRFHRQLEIYGGQIRPVVADDYFGFHFSIISKNFQPGFNLLMDALKTPEFDKDNLGRLKGILAAERDREDVQRIVDDAIDRKLFAGFPYSERVDGTGDGVQGITTDMLAEWYDRHVKNRKPIVVIIGDTEGTSLASYFVKHFSGSRFLESDLPEGFAKPVEKRETIETAWNRSQSLVAIAFQAPPSGDVDRHAVEALQSYFGHMGRLSQELGDRKGYSHKVCLRYEPRLRGGSFLAYAWASSGKETEVLDAIEREFRRGAVERVSYREFRSAVNTAAGDFLLRSQAPFEQIGDVAACILAGEGIGGYRSFLEKLQSVRDDDLKNAADRIFKMENAVLLRIYARASMKTE
jgi:zinc protease